MSPLALASWQRFRHHAVFTLYRICYSIGLIVNRYLRVVEEITDHIKVFYVVACLHLKTVEISFKLLLSFSESKSHLSLSSSSDKDETHIASFDASRRFPMINGVCDYDLSGLFLIHCLVTGASSSSFFF